MLRNKKDKKGSRAEFKTIDDVREYIREVIRKRLQGEVPVGFRVSEREKYKQQTRRLRGALRACVCGDSGEKEFLKRYILKELQNAALSVKEKEALLKLHAQALLPPGYKFNIMLYRYMQQYGSDGFLMFCDRWSLPKEIQREDGVYFEIDSEHINEIYQREAPVLNEREQMEIITDFVYEAFGHGIIDRLRDCKLDGISGGVSGIPEQFIRYGAEFNEDYSGLHSHDSIFVMVRGNTVRLSFFSFENEKELRRVTKSLLRYEAPGELSYYHPYMVNDMKDGSRVFACRPPFSESWAFFIRKFDSIEERKAEELIQGPGAESMIQAIKWFVRGGLHVAITGPQGSGKTTLLKALVRYINPKYNLRIEESVFELWMRKEFPRRNILTFRETDSVDSTEALEAFRKTDGNCLMMGEIGSVKTAALMIELSQVSEQQLFTHHAMSTEKLLGYFRNALLRTGMYSDESMAKEQTAEAFQIHVLCEKDLSGHRYIKEIAEIIPSEGGGINGLFSYEGAEYRRRNLPTEALLRRMAERMGEREKKEMYDFFYGGVGE